MKLTWRTVAWMTVVGVVIVLTLAVWHDYSVCMARWDSVAVCNK